MMIFRLVLMFGLMCGIGYVIFRVLRDRSYERVVAERDEAKERLLAVVDEMEQAEVRERDLKAELAAQRQRDAASDGGDGARQARK